MQHFITLVFEHFIFWFPYLSSWNTLLFHVYCGTVQLLAVTKLSHVKCLKQRRNLLKQVLMGFGVVSICFGVCGDPNFLIVKGVWLVLLLPSSWWAFYIPYICQDSEGKLLHCSSSPRHLNSSWVCACTFYESGKVADPVGKQHQVSGMSKENNQKYFFKQTSGLCWFLLWGSCSVIRTLQGNIILMLLMLDSPRSLFPWGQRLGVSGKHYLL